MTSVTVDRIEQFARTPRIAYFSMEIALESAIPTYAGGLGVLAGDVLRSAADMNLPMIGVTLVSSGGYFRQHIDDGGRQHEVDAAWDPQQHGAVRVDAAVAVNIEGRQVWLGAWLYVIRSRFAGCEPVLLLDTDLPVNHAVDRGITRCLYGGDARYRLKQEAVLGIGGVRMLNALGIHVRRYHMNEGHSALLALELLRETASASSLVHRGETEHDPQAVRRLTNFTTHTPIEAGHDRFSYDDVQAILGDDLSLDVIRVHAGYECLDMTRLAFSLSGFVNGVAKSHARVSHEMYPEVDVHSITNGVHAFTWTCAPFVRLYDRFMPRWCCEPEALIRADQIPDEEIVAAHREQKGILIDRLNRSGAVFNPEHLTIGFGRRMTEYKRPALLFSDIDRLLEIASRFPLQLVFAGKAHPHDEPGKELIASLRALQQRLQGRIPMAFIPDYDMDTGLLLVSGVDVWLNTPRPPLEASGTSGMKAALNGVPSLSILDGWWLEGWIEGVTGWAIDSVDAHSDSADAAALYDKLANVVLPTFYRDPSRWISVMKGAISRNGSMFNSHRMVRRYAAEVYCAS